MKKFKVIFFITIFFSEAYSQEIDTTRLKFNYIGYQLPISILNFKSKTNSSQKTPLIFFLHGAGERGVDNKSQLLGGIPDIIKFFKTQSNSSCVVIAPQCPKEQKWVDTDWTLSSHKMKDQMSWPLEAAVNFLDSFILSNPYIDTDRIYVSGLSMGGFATWELIQRFPNKFTAAIPVCGGGDTAMADKIKNIPVWAFHGKKDKVVLVNRTTDMIYKMKKVNKNVKVTIYPNDGHYIWKKVYGSKEIMSWFFSKRKNH